MVTYLTRRNTARICGSIGVQSVLVSADIKVKRENIRKNVTAWSRKPYLGMISRERALAEVVVENRTWTDSLR